MNLLLCLALAVEISAFGSNLLNGDKLTVKFDGQTTTATLAVQNGFAGAGCAGTLAALSAKAGRRPQAAAAYAAALALGPAPAERLYLEARRRELG